jgi:hypothetical protein
MIMINSIDNKVVNVLVAPISKLKTYGYYTNIFGICPPTLIYRVWAGGQMGRLSKISQFLKLDNRKLKLDNRNLKQSNRK